jgi:GTP-binding protein HflX
LANPGGSGAFVIHVEPRTRVEKHPRDAEERLAEAVGLTAAIGLNVTEAIIAPLARPAPATLLGSGKVAEIAILSKAQAPQIIIVNAQLSPVQQRNLEKEWAAKVLDRTALILEIFGQRAATREGRLQVELAHLTWQRSRLVRSWTHLERQRGGFGFLGGPGETQIESDRRMIGTRIVKIKKELEGVKRTRALGRSARRRVPFPVIALVGYTNAGKSTLFNRLTHAQVLAKDLLFATLDPTMRGLTLPQGTKVILSDTVGFIADLPTELVAAFRATLEEVLEADLIVHVRDAAHDETDAQKADVLKVLAELGVPEDRAMIEVLNKIDLLPDDMRARLLDADGRDRVAVSALNGAGMDRLLAQLEADMTDDNIVLGLTLEASDGAGLAWVYRHSQVTERRQHAGKIHLKLRIPPQETHRLERQFPGKIKHLQRTEANI